MASMEKVKVNLGAQSYEIRIGSGLLERVGTWLKDRGFAGKTVIVTDTTVRALYAAELTGGLQHAGFEVGVLEVPPGEEQKTLANAGRLYEALTGAFAERATTVLALGGGVVGDLAGFVAATYLRGVPLVHVPTTLLAQVDSSIGGKTAVDHGRLKNMIGVFYQPVLVVADIDTLKTLPEVELANGLGEAIKCAAMGGRKLFDFLDMNIAQARGQNPLVLNDIVVEAARIKAAIVGEDERESGRRSLLNFGHTVGHAVEAVSGFSLKHGQAVAIGMVAEARISHRIGALDEKEVARLEGLIRGAGLPAEMPDLDIEAVMEAMKHDKKVRDGRVRFVLLKSIGEAFISDDIDLNLVREVLGG